MHQSSHRGSIGFTVISIFLFYSINFSGIKTNLLQSARINSSSADLINAVNSLRISNGLPPYQINQTLMSIAQYHSDYQASTGTVTHNGSDGSRPFQRALSAGYLVAGDLSLGGFFSENIISGRNLTASDAVNTWQSDAPHLNTMLSSSLKDIGAGVSVVGDTVYYTIDVGLSTSGEPVSPNGVGNSPTSNPVFRKKIITSTPGIDGSIFHIVELGETIWSISQVYNISQDDLILMNALADTFIYVGDNLMIRPSFTPTPTILTSTPTRSNSQTPHPLSTLLPLKTSTATPPIAVPESNPSNQIFSVTLCLIFLSAGYYFLLREKRINK